MIRVRVFIALAVAALVSIVVVTAASAKPAPTPAPTPAPAAAATLSATQVACPAGTTGACVQVSGCNYGTSGVAIIFEATGQISRFVRAGTPGGCFSTLVSGLAATTWTVSASSNSGAYASTTVTVV